MQNNDCNGNGPHTAGEVRLMPLGTEPLHGNNILCRACWQRELSYRRERNGELGTFAQFDLPRWEDAKVYGEQFNVIKTWSNWDAIREEIAATFDTQPEAELHAEKLRKDSGMSTAYIVRPVSAGASNTFFPRGER